MKTLRIYDSDIKSCLVFANQLILVFSTLTKAQKQEKHDYILFNIYRYNDLSDMKPCMLFRFSRRGLGHAYN